MPPNVQVTFLPSYRLWEKFHFIIIPGMDWLYYYWWQWKAYRISRQLHAQIGFDLAHHATFCTWRVPSFLCLLPIPLVWGPVGGGGTAPWKLRRELGLRGWLVEACRHFCQSASRYDPFVRLTIRRAAAIIAANQETAGYMPAFCRPKVHLMACSGMDASEKGTSVTPADSPEGFIILSVGLLEPRKAGPLALKAFQRLAGPRADATLVFIGHGPERERLVALAKQLGIAGRVRFLGGLPRPAVLGWMEAADVFLFPSLEMLPPRPPGSDDARHTRGLPRPGGPRGDDYRGLRAQGETGGSRDQVVADLAAALEKLASDPALREAMGAARRSHVHEEFDWNQRGERMMLIYEEAMRRASERRRATSS